MTTKLTMSSTESPTIVSISDTHENGSVYQPKQRTFHMMYFNYDSYDTFIYPGYPFERTMYMYIWGILVLIMLLANLIVVFVLLQKKMRSSTNIILVCIAISDSLAELVTLPAYWATYSKYEPADINSTEGYILSKLLCQYFMITKYFLSKLFHTVSIWLTLFLAFQRFILMIVPFRTTRMFTKRKTIITCICICLASPLIHIYHLVDNKAEGHTGMCQWDAEEPCKGTCVYLVVAFLFRHFLPCVLLIIFTLLFVINLTRNTSQISQLECNQGNEAMHQRYSENRRISFLVIAIVIVFLIPEVPYGCFLLYVLTVQFRDAKFDLETNRAIHLTYEVSLVISFHLNFYIYTFFNPRFRTALLQRIVYPLLSLCEHHKNISLKSSQ